MDRLRSLARQLLEAAALGLLAVALLYLPPLSLAARLDAWLFDSWSKLDPPPSDGRIVVVATETVAELGKLVEHLRDARPRLVVATHADAPANVPDWLIGPLEVAVDRARSRPTSWKQGGHLWLAREVDGVVRRDGALADRRGVVPSLALSAARRLHETAPGGNALIRFPQPARELTLAEATTAAPDALADHIVVSGPAWSLYATPLGVLSEPQLVGQLVSSHLERRYVSEPLAAVVGIWAAALLLCTPCAVGWPLRRRTAVVTLAAASLLLPAAAASALQLFAVALPATAPMTWLLVTGGLLIVRRELTPSAEALTDTDKLARARRAANNGALREAWSYYRQLPTTDGLLPEIYDVATALEARGATDEAADLYHRIVEADSEFRDVAHRLVRRADGHDDDQRARMPATIGRYQLLEPIGRGAMGNVYLGRDPIINRILALKAIDLSVGYDTPVALETTTESFLREATIAGGLSHPNIVTIFDVGQVDSLAFIAMEYVRGHHLSEFASRDRLLPVETVLDLVGRAADALDYAHRHNVVHRDIKPANIMYDSLSNNLKITDFGIAKLIDANRTRTGIVLGTPAFMSPEQLEGKNVNGHTDLFALGVSLYQLLTGQLPFRGASMTSLMFVIANEPHESVTAVRANLPKWLDGVIDRALAKDPAERFANGAEMAAALRRAA
jgi:serine/threonine-protein kinase